MELIVGILRGDKRAAAKAISLIENQEAGAARVLRGIYKHTGRAHVIGVTGPTGTGKSTLVLRMAQAYRRERKEVGIVAVDPSSPITGGALLGDRIRMNELTADSGVFLRSMATRGHLGGVAKATIDAVQVLDALGMEMVIVETVGAGQAEVEIASLAHTTLVVIAPSLGDDVQALKAGILEVGDVFVVNKADLQGAEEAAQYLVNTLDTRVDGWRPPVLKTIASEDKGINEVVAAIAGHYEHLEKGGFDERRRRLAEAEILLALQELSVSTLRSKKALRREYEALLRKVEERKMDPRTAAKRLLRKLNV